jgi:hypothetical protein
VSTSCGGGAQLLGGRPDGGTGGADTAAIDSADTSADVAEAGTPVDTSSTQICASNSLWAIPTPRGDVCAGKVADQAFRFALCTCRELTWIGSLTTDSFNSTTRLKGANGSVGVDGYVVAAQTYRIGGTFWIAGAPAGTQGLRGVAAGANDVAKDLRVGGGIAGQGPQTVHGDVFSGGDITWLGLSVDGAIHVSPGSTVIGATAAKGIVHEPVTVPKPCDCAAPALDSALVVQAFTQNNDDAANGLSPTTLSSFVGPKTLDLPCGRYHFDQISGRDLTLHLRGRVAISVAGDVAVTGVFNVELEPGAELDLFVRGDVKFSGATAFGNAAEPAKVRLYTAGATVVLPAGIAIGANIYAPAALVSSGGAIEMSGALFADRFSFAGSVTVHYDEAIVGGRGCP